MVIKGRGMPRPHNQRPGDLFLSLDVEFPDGIPPGSQEKLLELLGGRPVPKESPQAEMTQRLSKRQAADLKELVKRQEQGAQGGHSSHGGGQQNVQCAQQ